MTGFHDGCIVSSFAPGVFVDRACGFRPRGFCMPSLLAPCRRTYFTLSERSSIDSWDTELAFVRAAVNCLGNTPEGGLIVLEDFRTSFGLPDILVLNYDRRVFEKRFSLGLTGYPSMNRNSARLMAFLAGRPSICEKEARSSLRLNSRIFTDSLECLQARELLENRDGQLCVRPTASVFSLVSVTAYEAKLRDWGSGIFQAHRHLWFTDQSFVLLPPIEEKRKMRVASRCSTLGVGLAIFDGKQIQQVNTLSGRYLAMNWLAWLLNETVVDVNCGACQVTSHPKPRTFNAA